MRRLREKKEQTPQDEDNIHALDSDSDVSLMSVGDDDTPATGVRRVDLLDQPTTWAEVDAAELERVALSIARTAIPELERADPSAVLLPDPDADNADPLGLGYIDPRTLSLVTTDFDNRMLSSTRSP